LALTSNGYLYAVSGTNASAYQGTVYYATLNANGSTGTWNTSAATGFSNASGALGIPGTVINGRFYEVAGTTVKYSSTQRLQVGGALDLVGLSNGNLSDDEGGGLGGELTAGNTNILGALQVRGDANFAQSVSIGNNLSVAGTLNVSGTGNSAIMGPLGLGTASPQTGAALTIANASWMSAVDSAGTGYVNMFQVNSSNQIQVGAALNVDGGIVLPTDGGQVTLADMGFSSSGISPNTPESYTLRVGSANALTVYGENDGSGNAINVKVAIGSSITPAYTLDVGGTLGASGQVTLTSGGKDIFLNGSTSNSISYSSSGVGAPTFSTTSVGTKIILYPALGASTTDYAIGMESNTIWNSVNDTTGQFKWYGGTTQAALLSGTGNLTLGASGTGTLTSGTINGLTLSSTAITSASSLGVDAATTASLGSSTATAVNVGNASAPTNILGATYTTSTKGVQIGTADGNITLLDLDQSTTTSAETAGNCSTSINPGGIYYATGANSNAATRSIRGCINGTFQDVISADQLGVLLLGVVPDSGSANQGDMSNSNTGPCKVAWASATTVTVNPCVAYSGGRKVVLTASTTLTMPAMTASQFVHICFTNGGTAGTPLSLTVSAAGAETANIPTFSATNPILCIADVKNHASTANTIGNIYDTRVFTNTDKQFTTMGSATAVTAGMIVIINNSNGVNTTASAAAASVRGVVAVGNSAGTSGSQVILATNGPAFAKTTGTITVGQAAQTSTTAGYVQSAAAAAGYKDLGQIIDSVSTTCTTTTDCQYSTLVDVSPH
jgi:hypothetical protein